MQQCEFQLERQLRPARPLDQRSPSRTSRRSAVPTPRSAPRTWPPATARPRPSTTRAACSGTSSTCKSVDTRGDPADAVPAVNQMFASTSNLGLVIGCTSDEAASVAPVINAHKMAMFCMTGQSEFDSVKFPYFYRLVPPDLEESYAMVAIAQELHYNRIALAFGNDIGSQTFIQPAIAALQEGRDDDDHQPDARPQRHHVPHRGRGDHPVPPGRDHDRGARVGRPDPVLGDQAAQRRQDDPDHRNVRGDLAAVLQVRGGGGRRDHVHVQLPRRQPGRGVQRSRVPGVLVRAARLSRARFPAPPATSPPT